MREIVHFDELASTNLFLKEMEGDKSNVVICADYQLQGRGQGSNRWESERGKNLLFSFCVKGIALRATEQFVLSQIVALSVRDALQSFLDIRCEVKWPNDIYVGEKKIAGILIEQRLMGAMVEESIVGIGLNVNQAVFRSDAPNPISMLQLTGKEFDRVNVLHQFFNCLDANLGLLSQDNGRTLIANRYMESLFRRKGYHRFCTPQEQFRAQIVDVLPSGEIVLQREDNLSFCQFYFKEVSFCL